MTHESSNQVAPKLVTAIIDRVNTPALEALLQEKHVHMQYMFNAKGTARSSVLRSLGLSGSDKTVCICIEPQVIAVPLITSISDRMELFRKGNGIAFHVPISGVSMAVAKLFDSEKEIMYERLEHWMETNYEQGVSEVKYSLVLSVINQGYSDALIEAAHSVGIPGGTIINARHANIEQAVKFFGVSLQSEKEIVLIVVKNNEKKALMQAITKVCGISTPANGVVISLPVENCLGLSGNEISSENKG